MKQVAPSMDNTANENSILFTPIKVGATVAKNRIFMAPLTRLRAEQDGTPTDLQVEYYRQRAGAGLIITEATAISATSGGAYMHAPSIHTEEQQTMWAKVAQAVHNEGGKIFMQLWHVGRVAHREIWDHQPVSASAIAAAQDAHTPSGKKPLDAPRVLETQEVRQIIQDFRKAARAAVDAGMDGVEVHSANGYLLHQFLGDDTNHRDDAYGGSPENRSRFAAEVIEAVAAEIGADRVAVRLSPMHGANSMQESDANLSTYQVLLVRIADLDLAYVHLLMRADDDRLEGIRHAVRAPFILNTGFSVATDFVQSEQEILNGEADAVAAGRWFISNPDLVQRLRSGVELTEPDARTFYAQTAEGYTDYAFATESVPAR